MGIEGTLNPNPMTFTEQDGMDFQAVTVKLPNGEYVPFMFTVKDLVAKGEGSEFKPGFQWGGEYMVPSYRGGGFLDPKGRGMYTGYDQAVGIFFFFWFRTARWPRAAAARRSCAAFPM